MQSENSESRIMGAVLGATVGDALGERMLSSQQAIPANLLDACQLYELLANDDVASHLVDGTAETGVLSVLLQSASEWSCELNSVDIASKMVQWFRPGANFGSKRATHDVERLLIQMQVEGIGHRKLTQLELGILESVRMGQRAAFRNAFHELNKKCEETKFLNEVEKTQKKGEERLLKRHQSMRESHLTPTAVNVTNSVDSCKTDSLVEEANVAATHPLQILSDDEQCSNIDNDLEAYSVHGIDHGDVHTGNVAHNMKEQFDDQVSGPPRRDQKNHASIVEVNHDADVHGNNIENHVDAFNGTLDSHQMGFRLTNNYPIQQEDACEKVQSRSNIVSKDAIISSTRTTKESTSLRKSTVLNSPMRKIFSQKNLTTSSTNKQSLNVKDKQNDVDRFDIQGPHAGLLSRGIVLGLTKAPFVQLQTESSFPKAAMSQTTTDLTKNKAEEDSTQSFWLTEEEVWSVALKARNLSEITHVDVASAVTVFAAAYLHILMYHHRKVAGDVWGLLRQLLVVVTWVEDRMYASDLQTVLDLYIVQKQQKQQGNQVSSSSFIVDDALCQKIIVERECREEWLNKFRNKFIKKFTDKERDFLSTMNKIENTKEGDIFYKKFEKWLEAEVSTVEGTFPFSPMSLSNDKELLQKDIAKNRDESAIDVLREIIFSSTSASISDNNTLDVKTTTTTQSKIIPNNNNNNMVSCKLQTSALNVAPNVNETIKNDPLFIKRIFLIAAELRQDFNNEYKTKGENNRSLKHVRLSSLLLVTSKLLHHYQENPTLMSSPQFMKLVVEELGNGKTVMSAFCLGLTSFLMGVFILPNWTPTVNKKKQPEEPVNGEEDANEDVGSGRLANDISSYVQQRRLRLTEKRKAHELLQKDKKKVQLKSSPSKNNTNMVNARTKEIPFHGAHQIQPQQPQQPQQQQHQTQGRLGSFRMTFFEDNKVRSEVPPQTIHLPSVSPKHNHMQNQTNNNANNVNNNSNKNTNNHVVNGINLAQKQVAAKKVQKTNNVSVISQALHRSVDDVDETRVRGDDIDDKDNICFDLSDLVKRNEKDAMYFFKPLRDCQLQPQEKQILQKQQNDALKEQSIESSSAFYTSARFMLGPQAVGFVLSTGACLLKHITYDERMGKNKAEQPRSMIMQLGLSLTGVYLGESCIPNALVRQCSDGDRMKRLGVRLISEVRKQLFACLLAQASVCKSSMNDKNVLTDSKSKRGHSLLVKLLAEDKYENQSGQFFNKKYIRRQRHKEQQPSRSPSPTTIQRKKV